MPQDAPKPPRIAWAASEFAEMTGLTEWTVRKQLRAGLIPATKVGHTWLIPDSYVQQIKGEEGEVA